METRAGIAEHVVDAIIAAIIADLADRHGLRRAWETFGAEARAEARQCWREIVENELRGASSPKPTRPKRLRPKLRVIIRWDDVDPKKTPTIVIRLELFNAEPKMLTSIVSQLGNGNACESTVFASSLPTTCPVGTGDDKDVHVVSGRVWESVSGKTPTEVELLERARSIRAKVFELFRLELKWLRAAEKAVRDARRARRALLNP